MPKWAAPRADFVDFRGMQQGFGWHASEVGALAAEGVLFEDGNALANPARLEPAGTRGRTGAYHDQVEVSLPAMSPPAQL